MSTPQRSVFLSLKHLASHTFPLNPYVSLTTSPSLLMLGFNYVHMESGRKRIYAMRRLPYASYWLALRVGSPQRATAGAEQTDCRQSPVVFFVCFA